MFSLGEWMRRRPKERPSLGGRLEPNSQEFKALFPEEAIVERLATGFRFTEGPVWFAEGQYLLFSDIPADRIMKLTIDGHVTTFKRPSGNSNGLTRDRQGRLVACEHGNRRVSRIERDGSVTVLADGFRGRRLNSPNDVVVKADGCIYFTDPTYGIKPGQREQPINGVYRLSPDKRELTIIAEDFRAPNGLAFSPDQTRLYVADSAERHVRVFDVCDDGTLINGRIFCDMNVREPGPPDGLKVDARGHVYCAGPGGVWVLDADGKHLGTIATPERPCNCAWGDEDWKALYITAHTSVFKVRLNGPGIGVP